MIPLKLTISAFCSYLDKTVIDFTKFGEKGLYLITGDTGSGKTTIFDAISYALYGEASGDLRDQKLFRSKNATPDHRTYVELTFRSKGKTYTIRRSPEQERSAKRGSGTVTEPAKATITYCDSDPVETKEIRKQDKTIDDIIGIDIKKFRQLSMIAQGDFMRVLNASTNEKTEILRAVFGTEKYEILQEELKVQADSYKREYEDLSNSIITKLSQILYNENSEFSPQLKAAIEKNNKVITDLETVCGLIQSVINEDKYFYNKQFEILNDTEKTISRLNTEIGIVKGKSKSRENYLKAKQNLEKYQKMMSQLKTKLDAVKDNENTASELEGKIKVIEEKLPDYEKLNSMTKENIKNSKDIIDCQNIIKQKSEKFSLYENKIISLKKEAEVLGDCRAEIEKYNAEYDKNKNKIEEYRDIIRKYNALKKYKSDLESKQKKFLEDKEKYETTADTYKHLNSAFLAEQAGIMAQQLKEGKPCPVCGALEHPLLAVMRIDAPTKEQVDKAQELADKANQVLSKSSAECNSIKAVIDHNESELREISKKVLNEEKSPEELNNKITDIGKLISSKNKEIKLKLDELKEKSKRKKDIDDLLPKLEKEKEELRNSIEEKERKLSAKKEREEGLKDNILRMKETLVYPTKNEAVSKIDEFKKLKNKLIESFKLAESQYRDCISNIEAQENVIKSFGDIEKTEEEKDIRELEIQRLQLEETKKNINDEVSNLKIRILNNTQNYCYITENEEKLMKLKKYYLSALDLSDTANGKLTGGREKVTLEVYAQMKYFDSILALANYRLRKMSNGKYEFIRSQEAIDKKGKSGLDIDVIDHDSATRRSVRSLSGGESFMASLSLALGFSDVIQATVGGVHLETMFIDEGFGTLDEKALENAYRVFSDLSEDGSCLVGIISHVEDLKSRINNRIAVSKDISGNSTAVIIA